MKTNDWAVTALKEVVREHGIDSVRMEFYRVDTKFPPAPTTIYKLCAGKYVSTPGDGLTRIILRVLGKFGVSPASDKAS